MDFLLLLLYEFLILMTCVGIFYRIGGREGMTRLKLAALVISTSMVVSPLIATALSFLQANDATHYLLLAAAPAAALNLFTLRRDYRQYSGFLCGLVHSVFESLFSRKALALLILFLPLLFSVIRPPDDVDSLHVMNSVLAMAGNHTNPYDFYYHYVAFWELSYVPSMTITDSDSFLWLVSVKPVILIGLGSCLAGRALGLPRLLIPLVALSGVMFFHFWIPGGPTGISTVKNDMIFGAGVIFLAYCLIRARSSPPLPSPARFSDALIFLLGGIFVLNKYSGVPVLLLAVALLAVANRRRLLEGIRHPHALFCAAAVLATTGHYYLKNLVLFQNPLYPIKFVVGGMGFQNGIYDLSGTSILSSLGDPRLWEHLLPADPVRAYTLVPVYLGMAAILALLAHAAVRQAGKGPPGRHLFAGLFVLAAWAVLAGSGWSASAYPGDMGYVSSLNSLRYVAGLMVLTQMLFAYALWRFGVPPRILGALLGVHVAAQAVVLYLRLPHGRYSTDVILDAWLLAPPIICTLALLVLGGRISGLRARSAALLLVAVMIFSFSPHLLESNRADWMRPYSDIVLETYRSDGSSIALIPESPHARFSEYIYPFSGNRFQHDVTMAAESQFGGGDGRIRFEKSGSDQRPDYVVRWCNTPDACIQDLQGFAERMGEYSYSTKKISCHGIVLHHNNASRGAQGPEAAGPAPNAVAGRVFNDTNRNGAHDGGEPGLGGISVLVYDHSTGGRSERLTGADGGYEVAGIPPCRHVQAQIVPPIPSGHLPSGGTGGLVVQTLLPADGSPATIDFPLHHVRPDERGTIVFDVYHDLDGDGVRDGGEPGIPGATVRTTELLTHDILVGVTGPNGSTAHRGLVPDVVLAQISHTDPATGALLLPGGFARITTPNAGAEYVTVGPGGTSTVEIGLDR